MSPLPIEAFGNGPCVVYLSAWAIPSAYRAPLVSDLARDHHVLVPVMPGYDGTPRLVPPSFTAVRAAKRGTLEVVESKGHCLLAEDLQGTLASIRRVLSETA